MAMMRVTTTIVTGMLLLVVIGCSSRKPVVQEPLGNVYARPLQRGGKALRLVTADMRQPDLQAAYAAVSALPKTALDHSLGWFDAPSSKMHFPIVGITHERARASLLAMRSLWSEQLDPYTFEAEVHRFFDIYESVGYDGAGTVLFTGYYSPILRGSRTRSAAFPVPLYRRPDDLVTEPVTGLPRGRQRTDGSIVPYYTRAEIENGNLLAGTELVWLENELEAYIVHVNGSAKLRLGDGTVMYVGYGGKTDRAYSSLGKAMIETGLLSEREVSLAAIKRVFQRNPAAVIEQMHRNQNFVFFREYDGAKWPAGSLGVQVTTEATVATDKSVFPRGGVVLVDTQIRNVRGTAERFVRFMFDQDTGGAIKAPGRADLFMGIGPGAELRAGRQHAEGRMYYLFVKEEYIERFLAKVP